MTPSGSRAVRALAWAGALLGVLACAPRAQAAPAPTAVVVPPYDGEVILQWTPEPLATAYLVRRVQVAPLTETPTPSPAPLGTVAPASPTDSPTTTPSPTDFPTVVAGATLALTDDQVTNGKGYRYDLFSLDGLGTPTPSSVFVTPFANPLVVSTLAVNTQYSGSIQINWNDSAATYPIAYYQVYRYPFMGFLTPPPTPVSPSAPISVSVALSASPTPIATTLSASYLDGGATPGPTAFYYVVRAVDNQGHPGDFPNRTSQGALAQTKPPFAPGLSALVGPSPTPVLAGGVRLAWSGSASSENVASYQVFRNATPIATVNAVPGVDGSYDDLGLPQNVASAMGVYYIGLSNGSGSVTTNTVNPTIFRPAIGNALQATPDSTKVTLTWNQASLGSYGLGGYRVYKSLQGIPTGTSTITPTLVADLPVTPTVTATQVFVDTPTTNASGLSYWVAPYDLYGFEGPNAVATPSALKLAPTPASVVSATGPTGNNRVSVNWSAGGNGFYGPPVSYSLYRSGTTLPTPTLVATLSAQGLAYQDALPGSLVGTPVQYRVSAVDALGNPSDLSAPSNAVTAVAPVTAAAPSGIQIGGNGVSLVFTWPNNPPADAVTAYQVSGPDFPTPVILPQAPGIYSISVANPGDFQPVEDTVTALNASGASASATLGGISVPPYHLTAVVPVPTHEVDLSWDLVPTPSSTIPALDGYRIYRAPSATPTFMPIATVSLGTMGYPDTTVQAGQSYLYRVTLKAGNSAESPLYPTTTPIPEAHVSTWPNGPTGLTSFSSAAAATLQWMPNAPSDNVVSYNVYGAGNPTPIAAVPPSPTPLFVVTLTPGIRSGFEVTALNAGGESAGTQALSILGPPAISPGVGWVPPAGATVTATPGLVWISGIGYSGDVTGFDLYRSTSAGFTWQTYQGTVANPATVFSDAGVAGYTTYYRLVAKDAFGLGSDPAASAPLSIDLYPSAPVSMAVTPSNNAVTLVWTAPPGTAPAPDEYRIYRSTVSGAVPTPIATVAPTQQFVDAVVTPGMAYYYRASAVNPAGEGPLSTQVGALALNGPTLALTPFSSRNTLVWTQPLPTPTHQVYGYQVYRSQAPSTVMAPLGGIVYGASTSMYIDTTVVSGQTYTYQVAPSTSDGALGGFSGAVVQAVLPQPVQLTAVSGNAVVQLRWLFQGGGSTTYTVQRRLGTESDSSFRTLLAGITGTDYLDTGLENKTFYVYRVITVASASVTSGNVDAVPAQPPTLGNTTVTADSEANGITLRWPPVDISHFDTTNQFPLTGYKIFRSTDGGGTYVYVGSVPANQTTFLDPVDVLSGDSRTYLVRAYDIPPDEPNISHESAYDPVRVDSLVAQTALDRNALRPFGLPNERVLNIRFIVTAPGNVTIKAYNLLGTYVRTLFDGAVASGIHWASWDGKNMNGQLVSSGVYLITTKMPNRQEVNKVAVVK